MCLLYCFLPEGPFNSIGTFFKVLRFALLVLTESLRCNLCPTKKQCSGSVGLWHWSKSVDPYHWLQICIRLRIRIQICTNNNIYAPEAHIMYLTVVSWFLISFVFFGPQMSLAYRLDAISQGPKNSRIPGSNPLPLALVMDMHASKTLCAGLYKS